MKMSEVKKQVEKSNGLFMWELLERKPENYDVKFRVGPEKTIVKAVKFVLKATSSVFEREFEEKWDNDLALVTEGDGITLPDLDPTAFQIFIKLLIWDDWSSESLKKIKLLPDTILSLLGICKQFNIKKAIEPLREEVDDFICEFEDYISKDEFLMMSRTNLETVLSNDSLPLEEKQIFECSCRWAEYQCAQKKMNSTADNIREVLGRGIYEIRFPTMSSIDFAECIRFKDVLTPEEKLAIYEFIAFEDDDKATQNVIQLGFKPQSRRTVVPGCTTFSVAKRTQIVDSIPFVCNRGLTNFIKSTKAIILHGFGFAGPIKDDSNYDVTVEIKKVLNGSYTSDPNKKFSKTVFARKKKVFYFVLDEPVRIDAITDNSWSNCYYVSYSLKGPETCSVQYETKVYEELSVIAKCTEILFQRRNNQMTAIVFKVV